MAKAYKCPIDEPNIGACFTDGRYDREKDDQQTEAFLTELREWCHANPYRGKAPSKTSRDLIGAVISFPWADGAAQYMVWQTSPTLALIHIPLHDAWHLPEMQLRGVRVADVRDMVNRDRRLKALFAERKATADK